jgi:hypothetical protein
MHQKAGYRLWEWLPDVRISRSSYYRLPPEKRPHSVELGGVLIIIEPPDAYLARMAADQSKAVA